MKNAVLKILIVDDEALARDKMRRFLKEIAPDAAIIEAENGLVALSEIMHQAPDILFLDIQMPGLSGFDVLFQIPSVTFPVVFQTAFDEFAVKAFDANACDYLLKPYSKDRFNKAFQRAAEIVNRSVNQVESLIKSLPETKQYLQRLCVDSRGVKLIVETDDAEAFVSKDHYTSIFTREGEHLSDMSLHVLESRLNPAQFMRIHRSALVNLRAVKKLIRGDDPTVELKCGQILSVSRRCKVALYEALKG